MKSLRDNQNGNAALALLGASVVAMIFLVGLADLGIFFLARTKAQVAADAAALAAAAELIPGLGQRPGDKADEFARRNGARMVKCDCRPGSQAVEVSVAVPVTFMLPSGANLKKVTARARAEVDLSKIGGF